MQAGIVLRMHRGGGTSSDSAAGTPIGHSRIEISRVHTYPKFGLIMGSGSILARAFGFMGAGIVLRMHRGGGTSSASAAGTPNGHSRLEIGWVPEIRVYGF